MDKHNRKPKPQIELVFEVSSEVLEKLGDLIEGGTALFTSTYRVAAEIKHVQQVRRNRAVMEGANAIVLGAKATQQIGALILNLWERKNRHGSNSPDQPA